ncbi:MAG: hypothetical protein H7123_03225 [Thermoleophilia bacterium]|nr:hypothetical protein [Thermoleophilia bacterium]
MYKALMKIPAETAPAERKILTQALISTARSGAIRDASDAITALGPDHPQSSVLAIGVARLMKSPISEHQEFANIDRIQLQPAAAQIRQELDIATNLVPTADSRARVNEMLARLSA